MELNREELNDISGGGISGAIMTSIIKGASFIFELGRSIGSSIRRIISRRYC